MWAAIEPAEGVAEDTTKRSKCNSSQGHLSSDSWLKRGGDFPLLMNRRIKVGKPTGFLDYTRVQNGDVPPLERIKGFKEFHTYLDDKARRILRTIFRTSMRPEPNYGRFVCPEHYQAARDIAAAGVVLLKNENNTLPLNVPEGGKILLVGENAVKKMVVGGGSSNLKTAYEVNPLEGIQNAFAGKADVQWVRGYVGDTSTSYNAVSTGQDLTDNRTPEVLIAEAVEAAKDADYVIFVGGLNKSDHQDSEGADRLQLDLPYHQEDVIRALAPIAKNLVVVNISGSPVSMPWADVAGAIVQGWYGGTETGNALADVLTGKINPSGKMPFTVPYKYEDGPIKTERQYPGIKEDGDEYWQTHYDEGIYVGYRWYEAKQIPVQWAFGHGLSYTTFEYGKAKVKNGKLIIPVKNTGSVTGEEVVQLYIRKPDDAAGPIKTLRGFERVTVAPGKTVKVEIPLTDETFNWWDETTQNVNPVHGTYELLYGGSSSDEALTAVSYIY